MNEVVKNTVETVKSVTPEAYKAAAVKNAPGLLLGIACECVCFAAKCFRDAAKEVAK